MTQSNKAIRKRNVILIAASFVATLAVFQFIKKGVFKQLNIIDPVPEHVTFTEHVSTILYDHCVQCHRPNGSGPFQLISYEQVLRKKKTIKKVVSKGIMPPWPADPEYSHFVGENILSELEKEILFKWIDTDFAYGDSSFLKEPPTFNALSNLGVPDLTIYMDSVWIEGNNRDKFLVVKSPFELLNDTFIRAIEFIPGEHNLVHHLNGHLLNYDYGKKRNVLDGKRVIDIEIHPDAFLEEFEAMKAYNDDGSRPNRVHSAINYLPGVVGTMYPEGIGGFEVKQKAALYAKNLHFGPIQEGLWDYSHYNIFFSKIRPERPTSELMLGTNGISPINPPLVIDADSIQTFTTRYRTLKDISILTINPHMHLLGKHFKAYAVTLEDDTIPLIRIKRWDFRWQYFYTFTKMKFVPKGSSIVVEATFDNTSQNPNNPFDPPRTLSERFDLEGASMRTKDEMFQFIITYLDYRVGDENIPLEP